MEPLCDVKPKLWFDCYGLFMCADLGDFDNDGDMDL